MWLIDIIPFRKGEMKSVIKKRIGARCQKDQEEERNGRWFKKLSF